MLAEQRPWFRDENVALLLALGLESAGERLDRLLAVNASSRTAREEVETEEEAQWLECVLGLISLREWLAETLADEASTSESGAAPRALAPELRGLLR